MRIRPAPARSRNVPDTPAGWQGCILAGKTGPPHARIPAGKQ
ncbi:hypothetical protein ASZ90_015034 [hydrocarbon metagenome]|uniref:Uncharacterized protein n=1 Tax=hydrocarbon metagenome TaxID=938273 RepID=A0A0W8F377_9ZZZZ